MSAQQHADAESQQNAKINEEVPKAPQQFVDEVKIQGETVFTISPEMLMEEQKLPKERKTRWGEFKIKKQQIQEDVIFNPLEVLISGNSLMAITQYGQAELELKMSIFGDASSRRKSKWHHDIQKTFTPPMMDYVSPEVGLDEVQYLIRLYRLDEITCKMNDFQEDPDVRSPSPEYIYDRNGVRVNTREKRRRDALLKEKVQLIEDCMKMRKSFVPPADYRPLKKMKRIYLTESALNDTQANYLGKIIGRNGETQKRIQQITGCSISLRGRGITSANKDPYDNYEKPHVLITADTNEQIQLGVQEIQKILNSQGDSQLPTGDGIVKILEGVFDTGYCDNCQQTGHRTWECPQAAHKRILIKCNICGEISHPTSDCPQKADYQKAQQAQNISKLESQYSKFKDTVEGDKPREASFSFVTDFSKKDMLKLEAPKDIPAPIFTQPVPLGGFTMPLPNPSPSIPNFDKKPAGMPNFAIPKFETEKKDEKDQKGSN